MNNIVEEINSMISADTETLSVLPKKTKKDIEEYLSRVEELKRKYKKIRKSKKKKSKLVQYFHF